jgi:hypothetical protein
LLRKSVIRKIDNQKGSPATFILHYVLNELRNIERSCARGTFDKAHKNYDAMDKVAFHFEDLDNDGNWIPELTDYENPDAFLIAQETLAQLRDLLEENDCRHCSGRPQWSSIQRSLAYLNDHSIGGYLKLGL